MSFSAVKGSSAVLSSSSPSDLTEETSSSFSSGDLLRMSRIETLASPPLSDSILARLRRSFVAALCGLTNWLAGPWAGVWRNVTHGSYTWVESFRISRTRLIGWLFSSLYIGSNSTGAVGSGAGFMMPCSWFASRRQF